MSLNSKSALGKQFAVFEYEGIREWLSAHITAHGLQDLCSACHLAFEDVYIEETVFWVGISRKSPDVP